MPEQRSRVEIAKSCFEWAGKLSELTLGKTETWGRTIINTISLEGRDHTVALLKEAGDALLAALTDSKEEEGE